MLSNCFAFFPEQRTKIVSKNIGWLNHFFYDSFDYTYFHQSYKNHFEFISSSIPSSEMMVMLYSYNKSLIPFLEASSSLIKFYSYLHYFSLGLPEANFNTVFNYSYNHSISLLEESDYLLKYWNLLFFYSQEEEDEIASTINILIVILLGMNFDTLQIFDLDNNLDNLSKLLYSSELVAFLSGKNLINSVSSIMSLLTPSTSMINLSKSSIVKYQSLLI